MNARRAAGIAALAVYLIALLRLALPPDPECPPPFRDMLEQARDSDSYYIDWPGRPPATRCLSACSRYPPD